MWVYEHTHIYVCVCVCIIRKEYGYQVLAVVERGDKSSERDRGLFPSLQEQASPFTWVIFRSIFCRLVPKNPTDLDLNRFSSMRDKIPTIVIFLFVYNIQIRNLCKKICITTLIKPCQLQLGFFRHGCDNAELTVASVFELYIVRVADAIHITKLNEVQTRAFV